MKKSFGERYGCEDWCQLSKVQGVHAKTIVPHLQWNGTHIRTTDDERLQGMDHGDSSERGLLFLFSAPGRGELRTGLQIPLAAMRVIVVWVELSFNVSVQCPQDADPRMH
jgi:hypothetical protein